jgi:NTP pyrophosphatase (non-canonical NTP hydrolase)
MRSLIDITDETARAHGLHGRSFEFASPDRKLRILVEEVGEVARALQDAENADDDYLTKAPTCTTDELLAMRTERQARTDHLRSELVQVASLAIRWIDQMDGGEG